VTRFWELGLGCLLQCSRTQAGSRGARAGEANGASWHRFRQIGGAALPVLGFALICGAGFLFDNRLAFPIGRR